MRGMKIAYEKPEVQIVKIDTENILTSDGGFPGEDQDFTNSTNL